MSTQMFDILEKLEYAINNASTVPLTGKIMLDKEELLDMIDEFRAEIPNDLKKAKKIVEDEERIKQTAQRKADTLIEEARAQKQHLIETNNITKNAYAEADAIMRDAKSEANKLRIRSIEYVTNMLAKTQDDLRNVIATIDENKSELKDKKKATAITKNVH